MTWNPDKPLSPIAIANEIFAASFPIQYPRTPYQTALLFCADEHLGALRRAKKRKFYLDDVDQACLDRFVRSVQALGDEDRIKIKDIYRRSVIAQNRFAALRGGNMLEEIMDYILKHIK